MVFYKNVDDLAEKIIKISQDEKLRRKIGKKGREKYLKDFNSTLVADFIVKKTFILKINKICLGKINEKYLFFRTDRLVIFYLHLLY